MTDSTLTAEERKNARIARQIPEGIFADGDLELLDEIYAKDAVDHNPFGAQHGREVIRASYEDFLNAFPDISQTVENIVVEGDQVALFIMSRGTHEGMLWGIEPTKKSIEVQQMAFVRIENGLIVERWFLSDNLSLLSQLNAIDFPPT